MASSRQEEACPACASAAAQVSLSKGPEKGTGMLVAPLSKL